ncbi:family 57 glycosyltransferase [Melampsora larici-populina 98AG31]|uniref:Alpha-1,3-glucosyltransferase n=1 Tax=Melampsora larici-populina (strain 98AG31 / pathotype 3-4-7) TaxID=747676 RepID=F4RT20_MELLP|nr:family 57 glycosyltransferase [Melampsora larici-populina 98AG31]EGG04429.1 family 57 glycosyltransferase [Melampsora larici-populina 98AG31]
MSTRPIDSQSTKSNNSFTSRAYSWSGLASFEWDVLILSTCIKLLLFPAYHSTDFEVHRNWLAITHSLPLSRWYYDNTSEWTLDYPPFFAYFERLLSSFAALVDPKIVQLSNLGYASSSCVAFQRGSVIVSELVLGAVLLKLARNPTEGQTPAFAFAVSASVFLHPGLLIVDHIHFQYNGFLLGILMWSIWAIRDKHFKTSALLFSICLNFKHIFVYLAPPYLIYLLRAYCFPFPRDGSASFSHFHVSRLIQLGLIVVGTCVISFGPFFFVSGATGITQILSRLFPFQRGLNHAYWAGNIWAVYSAVDRVLLKYMLFRGGHVNQHAINSTSRGLIGDTSFGVLPEISPTTCFGLSIALISIFMTKLWQDPSYSRFLKSLVLSAFTSFLFGWHVHEKAALLFLIPMTLLAGEDYQHFRTWMIASSAGIFGLFPLLIKSSETPIKIIYTLIWCSIVFTVLKKNFPSLSTGSLLLIIAENTYICGFGLVQAYVSIFHQLLFGKDGSSMDFLPLMITSIYCGIGIIWAYVRMCYLYLI